MDLGDLGPAEMAALANQEAAKQTALAYAAYADRMALEAGGLDADTAFYAAPGKPAGWSTGQVVGGLVVLGGLWWLFGRGGHA